MSKLTVRNLNIDLTGGFGRHWLGGDAYRTQLFNAMSMSFPLGEQSFIDSVRAVPEEQIDDPVLRAEVMDFVGQEACHRFVHLQYNAHLASQGLDYILENAIAKRTASLTQLDVRHRLACTCAFEHLTAMLADGMLGRPRWVDDAEPAMKTLWGWHAAEETEHKAVAFDLYRAVGGGYWRRVLWYVYICILFNIDTVIQTSHNLYRDGQLFKGRTWLSAARTWFGRGGMAWHMLLPSLRYLAPSFHPWQHDNRDLTRRWLHENADAYRPIGSHEPEVPAARPD